ncbi:MAG: hypothetical protein M3539_16690 [Acidobacteriota bacterium]|nr:hypothetical protein [Acidobacteriota bacterium]
MSTAKLNIWVTKMGDPCRIENSVPHFVYVLHCNGEVLEGCKDGKPFKYVGIPTVCGELELEIPPGCYVVGAVQGKGGLQGNPPSLGNNLTHIAIVRANCGDHICVTLFDPSFHFCGNWLGDAINHHLAGGQGLQRELMAALKNAVGPVAALVKATPQDPFVLNQAKALAQRPTKDKT